jgi:ectoine hydroxylase-related dioxygenase (phytanoyl-CoA dioxygenase family)
MKSFEPQEFARQFAARGSVVVENVLPPEFLVRARSDVDRANVLEAEYHHGTSYRDFGMILLCSLYGGAFLELFEHRDLIDPFEIVLGPGCIVYAYTSSSMPPNAANYSARIHVDCPRLIPGYVTNVGATILLDDFTADNGATWYLPRSHERPEPPGEEEFYRDAERVIAPAGSVWFFNARTWHAGGQNKTDRWRRALTINMARPWMKQRLDIPRAMAGMDLTAVPEPVLQKLGFLAQVPASYGEYYAPPAERKFRQPVE